MAKSFSQEERVTMFSKAVVKYLDFFGVKNYECFFLTDKNDNSRGRLQVRFEDKIANFYLCNECLEYDNSVFVDEVDKTAFHEACELFCFEHFSHILDQYVSESRSSEATHSVIRFMENEVYPIAKIGGIKNLSAKNLAKFEVPVIFDKENNDRVAKSKTYP